MSIIEVHDVPTGDVDFLINNERLYISHGGLQIYQLSYDGSKISKLGAYLSEGYPSRMDYQENLIFLASRRAGLEIIDVSDANSPVRINPNRIGDWALSVVTYQNYAYVVSGTHVESTFEGLIIIDFSDPKYPKEVNRIPDLGHTGFDSPIIITGKFLIVPEAIKTRGGWDNFLIHSYDLTNPVNPTRLSTFEDDFLYVPTEIILQDGLLFIASAGSGIVVLDVKDPNNLIEAARFEFRGSNRDLAIKGNQAFITNPFSIHQIDISDLKQIKEIGAMDIHDAREIKAYKNILLVSVDSEQGDLAVIKAE